MEIGKEIVAFSQSEKIKEGILWASQLLGILEGLPPDEKKGGEKLIIALVDMIGQEIKLAENVSGNREWEGIDPNLDKAVLMINSGVSSEASIHLSRALSKVTNIGQRSMTRLREEGLL